MKEEEEELYIPYSTGSNCYVCQMPNNGRLALEIHKYCANYRWSYREIASRFNEACQKAKEKFPGADIKELKLTTEKVVYHFQAHVCRKSFFETYPTFVGC